MFNVDMLIVPPYLKPGDRVVVVATARKVSPADIEPTLRLLASWGLQPVVPDGLYAADRQFAGTDAHRAALLQQALDDPSVRAVVCARGGYGTVRIVDRLDFSAFARHPKWIVGYSDVTVLHSHIRRTLGIATLHATMPLNIPADADTRSYPSTDSLRRALFGEPLQYAIPAHPLNRAGDARGPVVGGNLSILYSLCGSPSDLGPDGCILFIEDLDEYLYHLDRMMQNLRRCGLLKGLRGLLVGAFSDMHDNTVPFGRTAEEIILDAVADYGYPVCFSAPFGHIGTANCALPLGPSAHLTVDRQGATLTCDANCL